MILEAILALAGTAAIASIINLFDKKKEVKPIYMKDQLPGDLPVIALSNNGKMLNFLLDSGSNISHICEDCYESLESDLIGTFEENSVAGLGATNMGVTMCKAILSDNIGNKYNVNFSISKQLVDVAKTIEASTNVRIHGLLGTDFLKKYNYVIDFNSLKVYPNK